MNPNLDEIEHSLNQMTPGPLELIGDQIISDHQFSKQKSILCSAVKPNDGQFLAKAPEYVRQLVDLIKIREQCVKNVISRISSATIDSVSLTWIKKQLECCLSENKNASNL